MLKCRIFVGRAKPVKRLVVTMVLLVHTADCSDGTQIDYDGYDLIGYSTLMQLMN